MHKFTKDGNRIANLIFPAVFFTGIYVFFAFFYPGHLHFVEQFQLLVLTWKGFFETISVPGGLCAYLGSFLTQFYYLPAAGPLVIAMLLLILHLIMKKILFPVSSSSFHLPLSFVPSLFACMLLCNEFYPLSAIVGFLASLIAAWIYISIRNRRKRLIAGISILAITYWTAGGSMYSLMLIMVVFELILHSKSALREGKEDFQTLSWLWLPAYVLLSVILPVPVLGLISSEPAGVLYLSNTYYKIAGTVPAEIFILFLFPPLLLVLCSLIRVSERLRKILLTIEICFLIGFAFAGLKHYTNFDAEVVMTYDYLVRKGRWNDVIEYARKHPPRNYLSLSMLNLSLAKTGRMADQLFNYEQHGTNGLFLPFNREYVAPIMGNEILYNLGFTNASQQYAFESMETIPDRGKSARVIRRLAETNIINGQYRVSEKYLKLLRKTLFYRKWAENAMTYLYNEDMINNHPDWGEKRRFMIRNDYFFHVENIETALNRMVKEHPENKLAFEYLMAFYLIGKDLRSFSALIPLMGKMEYKSIPVSYQEAVTFIVVSNNQDPATQSPPYISNDTKIRLREYAEIYNNSRDAGESLRSKFSGTYWYYMHFNDYTYRKEEVKQKNLY